MTTFWHDDQARYDGQRPSWDTAELDPSHDLYYPLRGYVERLQSHIDDSFDTSGMAQEGGELPCRG